MIKFDVVCKNTFESEELKQAIIKELENAGMIFDEKSPQYVLVVGGDGTNLRAVDKYMNSLNNVIFIAIHDGTLGFYADFLKDEMDRVIHAMKSKEITPTALGIVEMKVTSCKGKETIVQALNEVTLQNIHQTLILDVYINDEHLEKFRGVGFCICSASGSTAYNKSLNGAVMKNDMELFQLTEIASINHNIYHSLNAPLILGIHDVIKLIPIPESYMEFSADTRIWTGKSDFLVDESDEIAQIECYLSKKKVRYLTPKDSTYINRLKRCFII